MADNSQTTDPLAAVNQTDDQKTGDTPVPWDADQVLPPTVRDPSRVDDEVKGR
jgi:hypothetical protein